MKKVFEPTDLNLGDYFSSRGDIAVWEPYSKDFWKCSNCDSLMTSKPTCYCAECGSLMANAMKAANEYRIKMDEFIRQVEGEKENDVSRN